MTLDSLRANVDMPILFPLFAALVGAIAGFSAFYAYARGAYGGRRIVLFGLIFIAVSAALVPNAGQQLYDVGLSDAAIDLAERASYFVFAFATAGAWLLFVPSPKRWFLLVLVPVSFAQPALWTLAHLAWMKGGFAP